MSIDTHTTTPLNPLHNSLRNKFRLMIFPQGNTSPHRHVSAFLECCPDESLFTSPPETESEEDVSMGGSSGPQAVLPPSEDHLFPTNPSTPLPQTTHQKLEERWSACIHFSMQALQPSNPTSPIFYDASNGAKHRFTVRESDWGFSSFLPHTIFTPSGEPKIYNEGEDEVLIQVLIKQVKDEVGVLWHNFENWDSKVETGHVGLKNQGATCYLNSLIQSLYHTSFFRTSVYQIPTTNEDPSKSVPYALQRLFFHMQFSTEACGTQELTRSFGWDSADAFHQHDVQELNRVLQDNLEGKMKGTPAEGAIKKLFRGTHKSYIRCVDVDFESARIEEFYDIQLNVKGQKTLEDSFKDYTSIETMDGENKYNAEGHGLQNAKKGIIFDSFPPVLHLQLKRFDYDMERDQFIKINDRHEYPEVIDLTPFLHEEAQARLKKPQIYRLQGALVHSGELNAGHYFAVIRPGKRGGKWYKFDDDRVIPATNRDIFENNFGGVQLDPSASASGNTAKPNAIIKNRFYTNAYMLVYVRDEDEDAMLGPVTEDMIPGYLKERVEKDVKEQAEREKEHRERHLYMNVRVVNDNDLTKHHGFDIGFSEDKSNQLHNVVRTFRVRKEMSLGSFLEMYVKEVGLQSVEQVQFWNIIVRQNKTVRPDAPYGNDKLSYPLSDIYSQGGIKGYQGMGVEELRLYARICKETTHMGNGVFKYFFPHRGPETITVFLKHYDPKLALMKVIGTLDIEKSAVVMSIFPILRRLVNMPESVQPMLYEEVKPGMVEPVNFLTTFHDAEFIDGDIIAFQRPISSIDLDSHEDPSIAYIPGYFDDLAQKVAVIFRNKIKTEGGVGDIRIDLSKKNTYEEVVTRLSRDLHYESSKLRLYQSKGNGLPGPAIVSRLNLQEMLNIPVYANNNPSTPPLLFYELLELSLETLERMQYVKVQFSPHGLTYKDGQPITVLVDKKGTVGDVARALFQKLHETGGYSSSGGVVGPIPQVGQVKEENAIQARIEAQERAQILHEEGGGGFLPTSPPRPLPQGPTTPTPEFRVLQIKPHGRVARELEMDVPLNTLDAFAPPLVVQSRRIDEIEELSGHVPYKARFIECFHFSPTSPPATTVNGTPPNLAAIQREHGWGIPFYFLVVPGETLEAFKGRLSQLLLKEGGGGNGGGYSQKEVDKIRVGFWVNGEGIKPHYKYIEELDEKNVYLPIENAPEPGKEGGVHGVFPVIAIGLEHGDKFRKSASGGVGGVKIN